MEYDEKNMIFIKVLGLKQLQQKSGEKKYINFLLRVFKMCILKYISLHIHL